MTTLSSTTLDDLETALRDRIRSMAVTIADERTAGWTFADDGIMPGTPAVTPRLFELEWQDVGESVLGGATGNADSEVAATLRVVTDYRVFPLERLSAIIESDHWDLHDRLSEGLQPIVTGLMWVESKDPRVEAVDEAGQRIAHLFRIQYLRDRRPS